MTKIKVEFEIKCNDCGTNCGVFHCRTKNNIIDLCNKCLEKREETEKTEHLEKMKTIHIDRIKVTTKDNREFFGLKFIDSEDNSHTYIDFRIVDDSRLNDLVEHGCQIDVVSSKKYFISNSNIFTDGKNRELGQVNFERRSCSGRGFGGHFRDGASVTYMLAYAFSRMLSNDIKIYKLNGRKLNLK